MHTATLLHDDVVDESDMRRGKLAARKLWGNEASVLVGDFLLGQAFRMMVEVGSLACLDVLSVAATVIAEGEVMQLAAAKDTETTEDAYLAVIRGKTAELFAAAAEVGPTVALRPKAEIAACRAYGMNLGIAFQLIDDALDYGGHGGQARQECRRRFPRGQDHPAGGAVVPARQRGRARVLEEEAGTGRHRGWRSGKALALMTKHRALEDTVERARHYGAMARDAMGHFPGFARGSARWSMWWISASAARIEGVERRASSGTPEAGRGSRSRPLHSQRELRRGVVKIAAPEKLQFEGRGAVGLDLDRRQRFDRVEVVFVDLVGLFQREIAPDDQGVAAQKFPGVAGGPETAGIVGQRQHRISAAQGGVDLAGFEPAVGRR